MIGMLS
jgi:hypothetical protein